MWSTAYIDAKIHSTCISLNSRQHITKKAYENRKTDWNSLAMSNMGSPSVANEDHRVRVVVTQESHSDLDMVRESLNKFYCTKLRSTLYCSRAIRSQVSWMVWSSGRHNWASWVLLELYTRGLVVRLAMGGAPSDSILFGCGSVSESILSLVIYRTLQRLKLDRRAWYCLHWLRLDIASGILSYNGVISSSIDIWPWIE